MEREELLKALNTLKTTVNDKEQALWGSEATTKCYNAAINKFEEEIKRLSKDIARIKEESKELRPQIEILERCTKVQAETVTVSEKSLLVESLHKQCVIDKLKKYKDEADRLVEEHSQYYESCKEKLERSNPAYKILQEKMSELKRLEFNNLQLKHKIIQFRKVNTLKRDIARKLFYADIVGFAKAWLNSRKYLDDIKRMEQVKREEREWMIKLMDITEKLKQKQKEGYSKKEIHGRPIHFEFFKTALSNADLPGILSATDINVPTEDKRMSELKNLIDEGKINTPDSLNNNAISNQFSKTCLVQPELNPAFNKVRILENTVVKPQERKVSSKSERMKAIDKKLQRMAQQYKTKMTPYCSQKSINSPCSGYNFDEPSSQKSSQQCEVAAYPNPENQTGASQEFLNININSQDMNNARISQLSQESQQPVNNLTSELFKIPTKPANVSFKRTPDIKFIPQDIFNNGVKNRAADLKINKENKILGQTPSKQVDGNSKTTPFSINFAGSKQNDAFRKNEHGGFLSMALPSTTGSYEINETVTETQNTNLFKKPDTSNIFRKSQALGTVNDPTTTLNMKINDLEMDKTHGGGDENKDSFFGESQYNFGNIVQFGQDPDESYDFDVGILSPEPNTEIGNAVTPDSNNQSYFSFGQSNMNFGFHF